MFIKLAGRTERRFGAFASCSWVVLLLPPAKPRFGSRSSWLRTHTLADDFGNYADWIEIQNTAGTNVRLRDWSLRDNSGNLTKWRFPATHLPPGNFLVIFASNKNRRPVGVPLPTNFKIAAGGGYLALVKPDGLTKATEFAAYPGQVADVSYGFALTVSNVMLVTTGEVARVLVPTAANGVGFGVAAGDLGLNAQATLLNTNASAFVRLPFGVANPTNFSQLALRLKYDDGFVAWSNGVEVSRANAPAEDRAWNSTATAMA